MAETASGSGTGTAVRTVKCPECAAPLRAKGEIGGKRIKCPKCAHQWVAIDLPADDSKPSSSRSASGSGEGSAPSSKNKHKKDDEWVGRKLGQFDIVKMLGKGGMGAVYEAMDSILQRPCAIKVLPAAVANDPKTLQRFLSEARAASLVHHPNLVGVYQVGQEDGVTFIVMQLVKGGNCAEWVKSKGPMSEAQATWIIAEAARGLAAAHTHGIVHRDIKPANLMLDEEGSVKVADFGLAKEVEGNVNLTTAGEVIGTPSYMSPEQCKGDPVDHRSDIYSLAATYFYLLTGRPPFTAENSAGVLFKHVYEPIPDPRQHRPELPEGVWQVILRGLAKTPDTRYNNADEMIADLGGIEFGNDGVRQLSEAVDLPDAAALDAAMPRPKSGAAKPVTSTQRTLGSNTLPGRAGSSGLPFASGGPKTTATAKPIGRAAPNGLAKFCTLQPPMVYYTAGGLAAAVVLLIIAIVALRGGKADPGAKDAAHKKGGSDDPLEKVRQRWRELSAKGREAGPDELVVVIKELGDFRAARMASGSPGEQDLGQLAGEEIERLNDKLRASIRPEPIRPDPKTKTDPDPPPVAGGNYTIFDGSPGPYIGISRGWSIVDGELRYIHDPANRAGMAIARVPDFADFDMKLKLKWDSAPDNSNDLSFHYRGNESGYSAYCFAPSHTTLNEIRRSNRSRLGTPSKFPKVGQWHDITISVRGTRHTVTVDGEVTVQGDGGDTAPGRLTLQVSGGNVSVKDWTLTVVGR